ncbi:hypothetical protein ACG83_17460 [Frankia sp. R43]|uniref:hypothetical protein n=1 Tax=Frankia sp. R43 TaxID=269536 RepID=UPI0006C9EF4E|nr:hypothetical protein [Frankia sp. R43]KPM55288.1 hypothetical protein ACG83_17460 [Frankia sp. R43]
MQRGTNMGGALFVCCALANALGLLGLVRAFGYPYLLNEPAEATLADLGAHLSTLIPFAALAATAAFLLVPLTARLIRPSPRDPLPTQPVTGTADGGRHTGPLGTGPLDTGPSSPAHSTPHLDGRRRTRRLLLWVSLATSTMMIFEWSIWLVGVPLLARPTEVPGRIPPEVITFDLLRVTAGVVSGETLGALLLAAWTTLVATHFIDPIFDGWWPFGPLRPIGRGVTRHSGPFGPLIAIIRAWVDSLRVRGMLWSRPALVGGGFVCAALLVGGAAATAGLVPLAPLPLFARMVWSLWLAAVGVAIWIAGTPARTVAVRMRRPRLITLRRSPQSTGPHASDRPSHFERLPYRFAAYDAALRRGQTGPRPVRPSPDDLTADAVTVAGDEVVLQMPAPQPGTDGHRATAAASETGRHDADADAGSGSGTGAGAGAGRGQVNTDPGKDVDPPTEIVGAQGDHDRPV